MTHNLKLEYILIKTNSVNHAKKIKEEGEVKGKNAWSEAHQHI